MKSARMGRLGVPGPGKKVASGGAAGALNWSSGWVGLLVNAAFRMLSRPGRLAPKEGLSGHRNRPLEAPGGGPFRGPMSAWRGRQGPVGTPEIGPRRGGNEPLKRGREPRWRRRSSISSWAQEGQEATREHTQSQPRPAQYGALEAAKKCPVPGSNDHFAGRHHDPNGTLSGGHRGSSKWTWDASWRGRHCSPEPPSAVVDRATRRTRNAVLGAFNQGPLRTEIEVARTSKRSPSC